MKFTLMRRLQLLCLALGLLALLIVCSATISGRALNSLPGRFASNQRLSYAITDKLQGDVLELGTLLLAYQHSRRPEDLAAFQTKGQQLRAWIAEQRQTHTFPSERAVLEELQPTFEAYLATAAKIIESQSLDQFDEFEVIQGRLVRLGLRLTMAYREALHVPVAATEDLLMRAQIVIFAAQFALLALAAWTALVVYREMIAPLREELVESHALLARNEKLASLGVLAAGVAHEIRNPLTAIKARLFTQQKGLAPGSRERSDAEFIGREIDRLDKIVGDFLRFARPVDPELVPLSPAALLREVCELMAPKLREAGVDLSVERTLETPLQADPEQLKQVLLNLIRNAADALGGRGTIKLRAHAKRCPLGGQERDAISLEVEDDGPGIPAEVQERLFDPFFTTKPSGTGLGLSIAARIVEKHGGTIHFQTAANRGTTFCIVLPVTS